MNKLELVTRELNNSVALKMFELLGDTVPFPM